MWVGGEERDIHFSSTKMGQGASMALPIWAYYMKKIYKDPDLPYNTEAVFDVPEDFNPCEDDDISEGEFDIEEVYE